MDILTDYPFHSSGFAHACADPERGGRGSGPQLENHKNIDFLAILVRIPLTITKLLSQHLMFGHHRPPAKRDLNGVSLAGR